jgi:HEAT repeat protein
MKGPVRVTPPTRIDPMQGTPPGFWNYEKGDAQLPKLEQRIALMTSMVRQRGDAATAALVYVLVADPELAARKSAVGMLAGMKNEQARGALTQAAADQDPEIRADALRALSRPGRPKPVNLLAQAARSDTDPSVRIAALELLSSRDGDVAQAVLKGALAEEDPEIRQAAMQAMRR